MQAAEIVKRSAAEEKGGRLASPPWITTHVLPHTRQRSPIKRTTSAGRGVFKGAC